MNCDEFTALLTELIEGELEQRMKARCEQHRAFCRDCQAYAASYEATIHLAWLAFRHDPKTTTTAVQKLATRILQNISLAD
jgi:anti-sigma factor RsiW